MKPCLRSLISCMRCSVYVHHKRRNSNFVLRCWFFRLKYFFCFKTNVLNGFLYIYYFHQSPQSVPIMPGNMSLSDKSIKNFPNLGIYVSIYTIQRTVISRQYDTMSTPQDSIIIVVKIHVQCINVKCCKNFHFVPKTTSRCLLGPKFNSGCNFFIHVWGVEYIPYANHTSHYSTRVTHTPVVFPAYHAELLNLHNITFNYASYHVLRHTQPIMFNGLLIVVHWSWMVSLNINFFSSSTFSMHRFYTVPG